MVSRGLSDFLLLILALTDAGAEGTTAYGRCPDCRRTVNACDITDLIGELLAHELKYHPEHGAFDKPGVCSDPFESDSHGDPSER